MKVKEVLACAALHMGMWGLKEYFISPDGEPDEEAKELIAYYNEIEKEIAADFFPLFKEEVFESETGRINYSSLSEAPSVIKKVTDINGGRKRFKLFADYLETEGGKVKVLYSYTPTDKGMYDECELFYGVSILAVAAGIIKNVYLRKGMLTESSIWSKTYYDFLKSAMTNTERSRRISSRRWV